MLRGGGLPLLYPGPKALRVRLLDNPDLTDVSR